MIKRCLKLSLLLIAMILLLAACGDRISENDIVGKSYTYEKDGCGGTFTITINEDGTFPITRAGSAATSDSENGPLREIRCSFPTPG